jgi:hypothetical protein
MNNIVELIEAQKIPPQTFIKPKQYDHLGVTFSDQPIWIEFDDLRREDRKDNNTGRPKQHTPPQLKDLQDSFAQGIEVWKDIPIASKSKDPAVSKNKPYKLEVGFGRINAIGANGQTGYWFWIVDGTESQISDMRAYENTQDLIDTKFETGEEGVEHHLKGLIDSNALSNDETDIEAKLIEVWPKINVYSKGRVLSNVKNQKTKPRQYQTYNAEAVKTWLSETAAISFVTNGNWDPVRNLVGFSAVNMLDPWVNACMQYAKTGKKSYVVMSVKSPGVKSTLLKKRKAHIDRLENYKQAFKRLGMTVMPLKILGFMPQDNVNEDMRYLVNANGTPIKK